MKILFFHRWVGVGLRNVFWFLFPIYILTFGWTFKGYGANVFDLAQQLIEKSELGVFQVGVVQVALSGIFYWLGKSVGSLIGLPWLSLYSSYLLSPFVVALTGYLVSVTAYRLFKDLRVAILLGLVFGLSTMAWPYSKTGMEDLLGLGLIFSFLSAYDLVNFSSYRSFFTFILSLVVVANSKLYGIIFIPNFILYLVYNLRFGSLKTGRPRYLIVAAVVFGLIIPALVLLVSNTVRLGSPFATGYPRGTGISFFGAKGQIIPFWITLYGVLFSTGKSFFLYNPPLLLSVACFRRFFNAFKAEAILILLLIVSFAALFMPLSAWADEVWGIRYLYPLLPLLVLPIGFLFKEYKQLKLLGKSVVVLIVVLGVYIQILGISFDYHDYIHILGAGNLNYSQYIQFVPELSPIRIHHKLLLAGLKNNFAFLPIGQQTLTYEIYQTIGLGDPGRVLIDRLDLGNYAKFDFWWKLKQGPMMIEAVEYSNPNFSPRMTSLLLLFFAGIAGFSGYRCLRQLKFGT